MDGQLYIDAPLTSFSQQYRNDPAGFIQDVVAPVVLVEKKTGKYAYYPKSNLKTPVNSVRTGEGKTARANFQTQWKSYSELSEHALKDGITKDQYEMYQDPLDPEQDTVTYLMDQLQLEREVELAAYISNTSNVTQYAAPSTQWNATTGAGSPFLDIEAGINQMQVNGLRSPNTIVMGYYVWSQLKNHPDLLDRVKYSQLGTLTTELMASLFGDSGITRVVVARAVSDTTSEGLAASNSYIVGKNLWLIYSTQSPQLRSVNFMHTLVLKNGRYVDSWPSVDRKTTYFRVNDYYTQFLVGPEAIYMIQGAVA
jgi:hypothetical protein